MIIPIGRFLEPVNAVARNTGKIGRIHGEIIKPNPSIKPKNIVTKFESIKVTLKQFAFS